jgi:hypothetical protein
MTEFEPGSFGILPLSEKHLDKDGDLWVSNKNLTSLEGGPEVVRRQFNVDTNQNLTSLMGGPKEVGSWYSAHYCGLTSLDGIPVKIGGMFDISSNPLTSLRGINKLKEMDGPIHIFNCPITSHILGVFFIKGCTRIDYGGELIALERSVKIVNRHIQKGRAGLLACTQELIEAGLADFAQI